MCICIDTCLIGVHETGHSEANSTGLCRDGKCQVKFGSGKSEVIQDAEFVDSNTLK